MTVALVTLAVLTAASVLAVVVLATTTIRRIDAMVTGANRLTLDVLTVDRLERERMLRVIVAKNSGELANLERVENAARKIEAEAARPAFRDEAEYQAWLAADLEAMEGPDAARRVFEAAPLTPEGL